MKTFALKLALLAASLLSALSTVSAETVHAKIPFGFSAQGTALPAGVYTIRVLLEAPSVLQFENQETGAMALVFARLTADVSGKRTQPLQFTGGATESMQLTHVETLSGTYELGASLGRTPVKGAVLALTPAK